MYATRFYRAWTQSVGSYQFRVIIKESDLWITCDQDLAEEAKSALREVRQIIEAEIQRTPELATSLTPLTSRPDADPVIHQMFDAAQAWEVGPLATVAGVVAEAVARALLAKGASTVLVENGGDIFAQSPEPLRCGLYAGEASPFADRLAFEVRAASGVAVCTSSGRVGPSLSFGRADAVAAIAPTGAMADAAATAIANRIREPQEVGPVVSDARCQQRLGGLVACCGEQLGIWGDLELTDPRRKS